MGSSILESGVLSSQVVEGHSLCPAVPLLDVYPRESLAHGLQEISIWMSRAVLFVITETGNNPKVHQQQTGQIEIYFTNTLKC